MLIIKLIIEVSFSVAMSFMKTYQQNAKFMKFRRRRKSRKSIYRVYQSNTAGSKSDLQTYDKFKKPLKYTSKFKFYSNINIYHTKQEYTDLNQPSYITHQFYTQQKTIDLYLKRKTPKEGNKEYFQQVEDKKLQDGLYECVLSALYSLLSIIFVHPDRYLGPAVLMQAQGWIVDSKDEYQMKDQKDWLRMLKQRIGMCSLHVQTNLIHKDL